MQFDNRYSRLADDFYSIVAPTPLESPFLISWNQPFAEELGLEEMTAQQIVDHFGRMVPLPDSKPIAAVYAGHQFGHFVPQLGDGRSILLGEMVDKRDVRWDLHLKGAGRTPYSRMGDGRAVLRSTIREYLCSEAMHGLGIPTTRALTIIGSEEEVFREKVEYGATLLRLSPSHVRFGTFEYFYYRNEFEKIPQLLDHLIEHHFPALQSCPPQQQPLELFKIVCKETAELIAGWQLVGFAHGVMNTDNMSILGLTIDYGPYGFLDHYDPHWICNHSDHTGRYAFNRQPQIGQWNISCLGQTLIPFVGETPEQGQQLLLEVIEQFQHHFERAFNQGLSEKLGIEQFQPEDRLLHQQWLDLLQQQGVDYTQAFRALSQLNLSTDPSSLYRLFTDQKPLIEWLQQYQYRLQQQQWSLHEATVMMLQRNPKYILRNYMAQVAIEEAEQGEYQEIERLLELLRNPFDEQPKRERYAATPPPWANTLSVSCSS